MSKNLLTHAGILETDIQYPNLPNESLEPQRIQSHTEICYSSYWCRPLPRLQSSLALTCEIHTEHLSTKIGRWHCTNVCHLHLWTWCTKLLKGVQKQAPYRYVFTNLVTLNPFLCQKKCFLDWKGFAVVGRHRVEVKKDFDFCLLY